MGTTKSIIDYAIDILPILISFLALTISISARSQSKRESRPNFRIVENLWTEEPYFELINEAESKLDNPLNPTYLLFIPSKVFWVFNNGERKSTLVLSPVSYEVIKEQIVSGITRNQIVKSMLPPAFFAKKGDRDIIRSSQYIRHLSPEIGLYVETYPFLVVVSAIEYQYNGQEHTDILLSTSFDNQKLDEAAYFQLMEYMRDNYKQEVKLPSDGSSIYKQAYEQVCSAVRRLEEYPTFFGGKEGGYGFILKELNKKICPEDPLGQRPFEEA